jgi:hypothetical protein
MNKPLTFFPSTIASTASKMDDGAFDKSIESFKEKKYLDSFYALLDYIDSNLRSKYGNSDGTEFTIPHGSIIVNIKIADDEIKITAPFLSLPEKNRVPLLRQIAGLNFNNLDLAAIVLKDKHLFFEYACPLALTDPYKMYYILREVCSTGDRFDDEFVTKFDAQRIYEPDVKPYDAKAVDVIYDNIQLCCKEALDTLKEFENERKFGYAWYIADTTLMKILYYAHPQGQLMNDLNRAVWNLDKDHIPLPEVVTQGKQALEQVQKLSKEKLAEDLYFVETFVPNKRRSNLKNIQENFEKSFENTGKAMQSNDYLYVYLATTFHFYKMYFYNNVQDDINDIVTYALQKSASTSMEGAATVLYEAMKKIMDGDLTPFTDKTQEEMTVPAGFDMAAYMNLMQQSMANINMTDVAKNMQDLMASLMGGKK